MAVVYATVQVITLWFTYEHAVYTSSHPAETEFWSITYWFLSPFYSVGTVLSIVGIALACTKRWWEYSTNLVVYTQSFSLVMDIVLATQIVPEIFVTVNDVYPEPRLQLMLLCVLLRIAVGVMALT